MQHAQPRRSRLGLLLLGLTCAAMAAAGGKHSEPAIIDGFAGPVFGLSSGHRNDLLVADQGVGIVPIRRGQTRPPIALPGVTDVSVDGSGSTLWALTGALGPAPQGTQTDTGQGLYVISHGVVRKLVNLFEFEAAFNPHTAAPPNVPDSNPYDVQALGPHAAVLVDAGGNDLLRVDRWGNVKVLAVFPDEVVPTTNIKSLAGCPVSGAQFCALPDAMPAQAVPTSIAIDRRGYLYVGELKGFPAPSGESNIWRISPNAEGARCGQTPECVKVFDGGFTSIIDLAFGREGLLYVTEFDERGWAAADIFGTPAGGRISACNVRSGECYEVKSGLPQPTAIAFDRQGALWSTQQSLVPNGAQVVKVREAPHKGRKHPHFVGVRD